MKKVAKLVLMLCLILSGALSYAHGAARTESHEDGRPIELIESTGVTGPDRSSSIFPTIDGHILIVMFTENLGQVATPWTHRSLLRFSNRRLRDSEPLKSSTPTRGASTRAGFGPKPAGIL